MFLVSLVVLLFIPNQLSFSQGCVQREGTRRVNNGGGHFAGLSQQDKGRFLSSDPELLYKTKYEMASSWWKVSGYTSVQL